MLLYIGEGLRVKKYSKKFLLNIEKQADFSFSKNTTYGCGGIAEIAVFPKNTLQAISVFEYVLKRKVNYFILGNGSNVLASDKIFKGVVICLKKFKGIYKTAKNKIYCLAGTPVFEILNYCKKHNFGGLEYLVKIPATIGGIAYMNGGAGGTYIQNNVSVVSVYNGKIVKLSNEKCNFAYKYSTMRDINCLILGVELQILTNQTKISSELINYYINRRKNLPKGKSCGCVFKNPEGVSAGALIDCCNLKGFSIGTASVSVSHANFIINSGTESKYVFQLIKFVKERVYEKFGILLEEEVVYVETDDDN